MLTVSPAARSSKRVGRVLGGVLLLAAVLAVAIIGWAMMIARSALPQLDGATPVTGLSAPVSVTRDSRGVPAIEATNLDDLFFAQGYVTAQDRLFQMDLMRRAAAGELSEIVGDVALKHDREQRILGLRATADAGLQHLTAEDREYFGSYAQGVNAFIELHRKSLPVEFRILGYSPRPWTARDSLVIAYQMVETLSTPPDAALTKEKILAKLGPQLTADLYVNTSWADHPPGVDQPAKGVAIPNAENSPGLAEEKNRAPALLAPWIAGFWQQHPHGLGSNNWVISGAHTVSGKPLLSNDMHLGHQMPNLWYEAHLHAGDFDVAGVTLPGYPFAIVGHNRRIAWGFTNVGPTVEDVYIETFDDKGLYLTPEGWKAPQVRRESIRVKGKPDVDVTVLTTRHGPIVSDLAPGETRKISLRWTLYGGIRNPFFRIDCAQDWQQFRSALNEFDAPGQNVVFADTSGNIGYQATGKVPIRASGDGSLPQDGSDNAHEWTGYIPFDKLPSVLNPPSGVIATANGRITPDKYPYSISVEWEAPWRTQRIYRLLGLGQNLAARDMLNVEMDIHSEFDRFLAHELANAAAETHKLSSRARDAAEILRRWDGEMDANSAAPSIITTARHELKRQLLEPKLGPATGSVSSDLNWKSYSWTMETVWMQNVLAQRPPRWLPSGYSGYNDLLAGVLEKAVEKAPADLNSWKWGAQNSVTIQNPILGRIPGVRRWSGPGENPQSGSGYTVKASGRDYGPSERFTADLSNFDLSTLNTVTGQSGNILSPHYMDQWEAWYSGHTFPLPFSSTAVRNSAAHRMILEPK
jgi:penicillin amidase